MNQPEIETLRKLLENYEMQLANLGEQQVSLGNLTPAYVLDDITRLNQRIADLQKQISDRGESVASHDLAPKQFGQQINTGSSAFVGSSVNTGGGDFIGRDKRVYGDVVGGDKISGDKITTGNISGSTGIAIGRGAQANVNTGNGLTGNELNQLFAPLMAAIQAALPEKQSEALQTAEVIKAEVGKGKNASDERLADLIDGLIDRAPSAMSVVVSIFTMPILAGIAGPVTQYTLRRIQRK